MKKTRIFLVAMIASISIFISCKNEDPEAKYNFKDQNLQGKVDGESYEFGDGHFEESQFESDKYSIDLYDASESEDACNLFFSEHVSVFFSIPKEVGVYKLFFNLSNFTGQTVTLYNPDGSQNNIATEGAVEILTVSDTQITGRMDARMDSDNNVNGNFTVDICPIK